MSLRKPTSLRRWKARCRLGKLIPAIAIIDHRLNRWFRFDSGHPYFDAYYASPFAPRSLADELQNAPRYRSAS